MTTAADEALFLDTNILIYAGAAESPLHETALQAIQERHAAGVELWISRQIMREYLAALTRPQAFANPQPVEVLIGDVRLFQERFRVAEDGPLVTERLLALLEQVAVGGGQIHDANIVATMQAHGIQRLLTHNTEDFERFGQFITVLPLVPPE